MHQEAAQGHFSSLSPASRAIQQALATPVISLLPPVISSLTQVIFHQVFSSRHSNQHKHHWKEEEISATFSLTPKFKKLPAKFFMGLSIDFVRILPGY